jgi:tetratricopeptide (TPR) repeat protein
MRRQTASIILVLVIGAVARCSPPAPHTPSVSSLALLQALADSGKDLPRPLLPAGADTNSASTYYRFGTRIAVEADTAEMALYWAAKLDPSWAEPLYARFFNALDALRHDASLTYMRTHSSRAAGNVTLTPRQIRVVDSLQEIAWQRNPFLFSNREFQGLAPGRLGEPVHDGWLAFASSRFAAAESLFGVELRKHPEAVAIRIYRARALFYLGRYDGAVTELAAARDTVRRSTEARLSPMLPSIEMFDFAIGIARVQQDDFPAARAAFERALTENLAFYWAHTRLAGSALALHDTATALAELDMAIQLEGRDPVLRLYRAVVLQNAGRLTEADLDLRKAIELDPYYAAPYYFLAVNSQTGGDTSSAIVRFRQYLARAARDDFYRAYAVRALTAFGAVRDSS